jgi:hypothetical protein
MAFFHVFRTNKKKITPPRPHFSPRKEMSEPAVAAKPTPAKPRKIKAKSKSRKGSYISAHLRVIRTYRADVRCKKSTTVILDDIVHDIIHRVRNNLMLIQAKTKRSRINLNDMITAVKIVIGRNELVKHAVVEGNKSVEHYNEYKRSLLAKRDLEKKSTPAKAE